MDILSAQASRPNSGGFSATTPLSVAAERVPLGLLRHGGTEGVRTYRRPSSGPVASQDRALAAPEAWAAALDQLTHITRSPMPDPSWWTPKTAFSGGIAARTAKTNEGTDELTPECADAQGVFLQLTLAGWGLCESVGERAQTVSPGRAFLTVLPSNHRYYLPQESPGWTYAWIATHHPYVSARLAQQVATAGSLMDFPPGGQLTASVLRLVRGAVRKDFRDQFEAEMSLIEFVLALERFVQESRDGVSEGRRLMDEVRSLVIGSLPRTLGVNSLAAEFGLSRSYFGQYFREKTGQIPSHFATEVRVQEAARMLVDTDAPLKTIAGACGFADATHFCKVFRRFRHMSPQSFRQSCR